MPCVRRLINFNLDASNHIIKKHTTVIENQYEEVVTTFESKAKECKKKHHLTNRLAWSLKHWKMFITSIIDLGD